jgi:AAHS family 3-hydroxyphenylpropionic acid transporter
MKTPGATRVGVTILLCFLVTALEGFDIQVLGVAAPVLGPQLNLDPKQLGWLFSIGNIGLIFGALGGGRLADHWGRKRLLVASTLAFGLATLAMAMGHSFSALLIARMLAGVGFGAALPNIMAIIAELGLRQNRGASLAVTMCGLPVGGSAAALVSQLLPSGSWRTLFALGGLITLPVALALWRWLPDTYRAQKVPQQGALPVAVVLFGEGRALRTVLVWFAFAPLMATLYLILNWLPLLASAQGVDARHAPQTLLAFNLASIVGSVLIAAWIDRVGRRWPVALVAAALVCALLFLSQQTALPRLLAASAATGFFLMALVFALYVIAALQYPLRGRGTGAGMATAVGRVGSVMGPLIAGVLLAAGTTATQVLWYLVPVVGVAGVALFGLSLLDPENN